MGGFLNKRPLFTPEELEELKRIDAELDAVPVSNEEVQESLRRDRAAAFAAKDNKRAKVAERQRRYREANKEKVAEYQRRYREANKEKVAEYQRRYYEANKEKVAERQRQYYEANKEKYAKKTTIHPRGTGRTEANRCGD